MSDLDQPLNPTERYLHGINIRLDAIIHILSSLVDVYAKQNRIATTSNEISEETVKLKSRKK